MVDVVVEVTRAAAPTSTGQVDITTAALGGKTPKAVFVMFSHADADDTVENDLAGGYGFATGASNEFSCSVSSEDNVATSVCDKNNDNTNVIDMIHNGVVEVTANFVEFIADGVKLDFTVVNSDAVLITYVFFAGDDLSAHAGSINMGTGTTALDQTAPGFEPDLVLFISTSFSTGDGTTTTCHLSFGACANDGVASQGSQIFWSRDADSSSENGGWTDSDDAVGSVTNDAQDWAGRISDFDANGFSITPSANAGSALVFYLALETSTLQTWVGTFAGPSGTGDLAITGVGFTPQWVAIGLSSNTTDDQIKGVDSVSPGVGVFTPDDEFLMLFKNQDNVATMNAHSRSSTHAFGVERSGGSNAINQQGDFKSMDSDGFTLDITLQAFGTGFRQLGIAIEEVGALPTIHLVMAPYIPAQ